MNVLLLANEINTSSVMWRLPRDILHRIYSQWLGWEDLSRLDVACVEKSIRNVWLTSLTDLKMTGEFNSWRSSNQKMRLFYIWLNNRKDVTIWVDDTYGKFVDLSDSVVLSVLANKLRGNSLIKFSIQDQISSTLIENHIHLRRLDARMDDEFSRAPINLLSYLSSVGDLLKILEFNWGYCSNIDDLMVSVARSCPKLTRLVSSNSNPCSIGNLHDLYEQCPHLEDVCIAGTIETNDRMKSVTITVKCSNEDWAVCLSHALRRKNKYKQVTLRLSSLEDNYHPVYNLKSILEPYQICVITSAPEVTLISLLQDLPHLNSLHLEQVINNRYTDAILAAIIVHAKSLTELRVEDHIRGPINVTYFSYFDEVLSELITACQLLTKFRNSRFGIKSLIAISKHSSLREVELYMSQSLSEEILDGLLLDENVQWPSSLEVGIVGKRFYYRFNKESHRWIKRRS
eukprot:scaffold1172_cov180-Ochromonas_danica.AAC.6